MANYLTLFFTFFFVFSVRAQKDTLPRKAPVTCFDIKVGTTAYYFMPKKFNDDHYNAGNHGAIVYPQINTRNNKGYSPYISINGASRISHIFEVSYGLSYMYYVNGVSFQDKAISKIQNSDFFLRTNQSAEVRVTNHLTRLSVAPVFRIFNTKVEIGVLNLGYLAYSTKIVSQQYKAEEVIYKYNSPLDSIAFAKDVQPTNPDIKLKNRLHMSFSLGIEQEIPVKKYRYLVGVKGFLSQDILVAIAYVGIRFSKPYSWKE